MIPARTDRMPPALRKPRAGPLLDPDEVIANALIYAEQFDWHRRSIDVKSTPVKAVLDGLRLAGYEIVPMGRSDGQ